MLAAGRVPMLVVLGLGASGTPFRTGVIESAEPGRKQDARPLSRWFHSAAVVNGKIYAIGGGFRRGDVDMCLPLMEVYDTATNRWAKAADMPTPRCEPSSSVVDGRIFVMGGVTTDGRAASSQLERYRQRIPLSVVEVYDAARGRWITGADLATARGWLSTSVVNGKVYVIGGRSVAPHGGILEVDGTFPGIEVYPPTN
jgi:N-acetylneuraminic acid mutarotase